MNKLFFRLKNKPTRHLFGLSLASIFALAITFTNSGSTTFVASAAGSTPTASCPGGQCFADVPSANPFYEFANRLYVQGLVSGYACGGPGEPCDADSRPYYRPGSPVTRQQMTKFIDNARRLPEIHIDNSTGDAPVYIRNVGGKAIYAETGASYGIHAVDVSSGSTGVGIFGQSSNGTGVRGEASGAGQWGIRGESLGAAGVGVYGRADASSSGTFAAGVLGTSLTGAGVSASSQGPIAAITAFGSGGGGALYAQASNAGGIGVWGQNTAGGWAGYFTGNVNVTGSLSKGAGSFKIDHPLDPANKYLYHSFVESPDMMNIYNGNITTDAKCEAIVTMPDWFDALNRDFRYQLTPIGQFAQVIVSEEMKGNTFVIKSDKPNVKVSWQVTGIRQDAYANAHRIPVEEDKAPQDQGKYLYPTEEGQPESKQLGPEPVQPPKQLQEQPAK